MPGTDIEMAHQDRYTLAPRSATGYTPVQWYTLPPLFINGSGQGGAHDIARSAQNHTAAAKPATPAVACKKRFCYLGGWHA